MPAVAFPSNDTCSLGPTFANSTVQLPIDAEAPQAEAPASRGTEHADVPAPGWGGHEKRAHVTCQGLGVALVQAINNYLTLEELTLRELTFSPQHNSLA